MTERTPDDWTAEEWACLQADLDQLEREDPAVAEVSRSYDEMVRRILARPDPRGER